MLSPIARQIANPLAPLTMIVNNGALVKSSNDGTTYLRRLLPLETALEVLRLMPDFRRDAAVVFDRPRANQVVYEHLDWNDPRRTADLTRNREFIAQGSPLEDCVTEDPIQVMYSGSDEAMQRAEAAQRAAPASAAFSLADTYYKSRDIGMVDVILRNCSKGTTLAEWAALRGFAREEVMAIGDNFNDREMLEFAGLPIVMGNSVPELKTLGLAANAVE